MVATAVFNIKYRFKEAVSLGFLTVFLNSFYWELPLHLAELLSGPPHVGMLVQACRLIPLPWLLNHYEFDKKRSKVLITVGLFISYLLHIIAYMNLFAPRTSIHVLNRVFSLGFLVTTVYLAKPKKYMSIKEGVY